MTNQEKQEMGISSMSAPTLSTSTTTAAPSPAIQKKSIGLTVGVCIASLIIVLVGFFLYNRSKNGTGSKIQKATEHSNFDNFHEHFSMSEYEQMKAL